MEEESLPTSWARKVRGDSFESRVERQCSKESNDEESGDLDIEESELLPQGEQNTSAVHKQFCTTTTKVLAAVNACLIAALVITWIISAKNRCGGVEVPKPPYCTPISYVPAPMGSVFYCC